MPTQVYINLPVADLDKSKSFVKALGYTINPQFSDHTAACVVLSDHIYVMLLTHDKFKEFTPHPVSDAKKQSEIIIALDCASRDEVDETINKAVAAGATTFHDPLDYDFMYSRSFQDPDGHIWEYLHMDMSKFPTE